MSLIIKEDMERQISEMWSAINDIPDNAFDKDYAVGQGHFVENKLREDYRKQEQLRDAAPEMFEALKWVKLSPGNPSAFIKYVEDAIKKAES